MSRSLCANPHPTPLPLKGRGDRTHAWWQRSYCKSSCSITSSSARRANTRRYTCTCRSESKIAQRFNAGPKVENKASPVRDERSLRRYALKRRNPGNEEHFCRPFRDLNPKAFGVPSVKTLGYHQKAFPSRSFPAREDTPPLLVSPAERGGYNHSPGFFFLRSSRR